MKTKSRSTEFASAAALDTLERIGKRWTVQVLGALEHAGTLRYNEVQRAVPGIPQRMLTLALRDLERGGLVARTQYPTFPPRVDYDVTGLGREFSERLRALQAWVQDNAVAIPAEQERLNDRPRSR